MKLKSIPILRQRFDKNHLTCQRHLRRNCTVEAAKALLMIMTISFWMPLYAQFDDKTFNPKELRLLPNDPSAFSRFGYSAGISGDTMVLGAFAADGAAFGSGAAYIFRKINNQWVQESKLIADDGATDDAFGSSAAISGDTVVIGAPFAATTVGIAGKAYVFRRVNGIWVQQAKLQSPSPRFFGGFGGDQGVAISGDTIVVIDGLIELPNTFGAVDVFNRFGNEWHQTATLTVPNEPSFAANVAIDGQTVIVGSPASNLGLISSTGAAFVFEHENRGWRRSAKLTAADLTSGANFGTSTSVSGNLIAVGADAAQGMTPHAGAVYVFSSEDHNWKQQAKLIATNGQDQDGFGTRLAASGETILVGAEHRTTSKGAFAGAAYVFSKTANKWSEIAELEATDGAEGAEFGCSITAQGKTLVVGAGGQPIDSFFSVGEAYVYDTDSNKH